MAKTKAMIRAAKRAAYHLRIARQHELKALIHEANVNSYMADNCRAEAAARRRVVAEILTEDKPGSTGVVHPRVPRPNATN